MTGDGWLLLATRALRLFAIGFVSVILAIYLAELGLGVATIGTIFTSTLAGSTVLTITVATVGDRFGRRRLLMLTAALMASAGLIFALTDSVWLLVIAAFIGVISPGGGDVGSALALEQAAMAQTVRGEHRTTVFAWGNLVASASAALGALAAGVPTLIHQVGTATLDAYRLTLLAYAACGLVLLGLFARLSPAVEAPITHVDGAKRWLRLHRSRGLIVRFSALLALNSFAAAFVVQAFVAYWFYIRFGADPATLGLIFFLTNAAGALSYLAAAHIASRVGLINTMVFTHLPSNLLLMLVPAMPTLELAALVLIMRHALSQMDRPARESYTMAIVAPDERTTAASLINIATDAAAAAALAVVGVVSHFVTPGAFFVVAGILRCVYNGALFGLFRHIRPPDEVHGMGGAPDQFGNTRHR
ncbi:MAG: MFS transporter [Chloroflexi bacterium]|nr:MFS transporter [Chloroflexota bacterium]